MTIGIGAMCHEGKCVIMAADRRGSFADPTVKPHDHVGKQYDLPFGFVANTAGMKSVCQSVANELYSRMDKLKAAPFIHHDHVRNAIRESVRAEFFYRVDCEMTRKLGTTLQEFKKMPATDLHYRRCQRLLSTFFLNIHLTVAGFSDDGAPVLLTAYGHDAPEMDEMSIIGSGYDAALLVLTDRGQNAHQGITRTAVHVCEAVMAAERSDPASVGRCDGLVVLTPKKFRAIPFSSPLLQGLITKYHQKDTEPMDDDLDSISAFLGELHDIGITREEYRAGKRSLTPLVS